MMLGHATRLTARLYLKTIFDDMMKANVLIYSYQQFGLTYVKAFRVTLKAGVPYVKYEMFMFIYLLLIHFKDFL